MSNNTGDEAGDAERRAPAWPRFDVDSSGAGERPPESAEGADDVAEAAPGQAAGGQHGQPEWPADQDADGEPEHSSEQEQASEQEHSSESEHSSEQGTGVASVAESAVEPGADTDLETDAPPEQDEANAAEGLASGTEPQDDDVGESTASLPVLGAHEWHGQERAFLPPVAPEAPEESTTAFPPVSSPQEPRGEDPRAGTADERWPGRRSPFERSGPQTEPIEPGRSTLGGAATPSGDTGYAEETGHQEREDEVLAREVPAGHPTDDGGDAGNDGEARGGAGNGSDEEPEGGADETARAAPVRVGPDGEVTEEGPAEPERARKPRRRKRGLLVAGAALLVVVLGAGSLVGVPGLADRLGISLPDGLRPADPPPDPIAVHRQLHGLGQGKADRPTRQGLRTALAKVTGNKDLAKLTGVVVDPHTGKPLWQRSSDEAMAPGSTTKELTVAAALLRLDPNKRLVTKVVQGKDPSTAVILGGGDPTINSLAPGKDSVYTGAPHLKQLVQRVRKASGGRIKTVRIDQSRYPGPTAAKGWDPADIKAGNYAPIVPAQLDGGRSDPTEAEGTPRSNNPGGDLLKRFAEGIGAKPAGEGSAPKGAKVLGTIRSAPLSELATNLLTISDNVLAEVFGRELAIATGHPATFDGATKAVRQVLGKHGFDTAGLQLADTSGLSTHDKLPARLLGSVLGAAVGDGKHSAKLRPLLDGLPVAGGTGTLRNRYRSGASADARGWVRGKTGTLTGVSTLAGYVQTKDNQLLAFAFMSNGGSLAEQKPALDAIAAELRECGCR